MTSRIETMAASLEARFNGSGERIKRVASICGELTYEVAAAQLLTMCKQLRDDPAFKFDQLLDLTGVDYLTYGQVEWSTLSATGTGFSRGVENATAEVAGPSKRFAVVYHLMSVTNNVRLRLRTFCEDDDAPILDSVESVWASANWFEREAFDMFGVLFSNHPDMRRILTDYGFIGHPFRKDFPLVGNVEVRYDEAKGRVVYQPVTIEPRVLVPRVIRDDNRYDAALK